jgi:DNA helicase-2/ATP-dependent DNA helicase PcrA
VISLTQFHAILDSASGRGYPLSASQRTAVDHFSGPLWLIAGPGSGKSEVLVTRTLRLLCVDGVLPQSIFVTTFTVKAARNLQDRLASYLTVLQNNFSVLMTVDLSDLRIGTIHSLCNDIMQEYRYPDYQNVRLLDQVEQHLFIYLLPTGIARHPDLAFWQAFEYVVPDWRNTSYIPNLWKRAKAGANLFNHLAEDMVDLSLMHAAGGHWATLANLYEQYRTALQNKYSCDFAHLQCRFLEFLGQASGMQLLDGVVGKTPALTHVLVDEYQDTNPVQERIYLALAQQHPHNLTVVGDDDQALYRFRGGNVAGMVNFDRACQCVFGVGPTPVQLIHNYRSHQDIVSFFNSYISSFPEMVTPGVRAPGKLPVVPMSSIMGGYPAVSWLTRQRAGDIPDAVASLIADHLVGDGVISDLSQCVLLVRSAKDSPRFAGPFLQALRTRGINVYNPRSKTFMESEEVQCLLGVLCHVIDWNHSIDAIVNPNGTPPDWVNEAKRWFIVLENALSAIPSTRTPLDNYMAASIATLKADCAAKPGTILDYTLHAILFRILSLEPFRTWRHDPVQNLRLGKVTRLFDSYHSFNLDTLRSDASGNALDPSFLARFYHTFVSYLVDAGIDDDEDDDVIVPQGYLPVMTIHQSKGLEFPFVIVAQLGDKGKVGAAQRLEHELAPFRLDLYPRAAQPPAALAIEDDIRLLYVAYSRAEYALVLAATPKQLKSHVAVPGRDDVAFRRSYIIF